MSSAATTVTRAGAVPRAIERIDQMRRSPAALGGQSRHKEWLHFAVLAPGIDLLVNFSCCDDTRPCAAAGAEFPRIVLLVRDGAWDGDVATFPMEDTRVRGGRINMAFGRNRLDFRHGVFRISVALEDRPIELDLRLTPITTPLFVPSIPMIDGPPLHWVVVPRLRAAGWLRVGSRRHDLDGAPAYHDHNWGHFLWGHDISWEWGFVLPDEAETPWCLTFVRLTDRARTRALDQRVLLWRGEQPAAVFRQEEVRFQTELDYLRPRRVFKVPRAMAMVAPEAATDVPRSLAVSAVQNADRIECRCRPYDMAQVLIPSEARLGVTIFNEVAARSEVEGLVGGEPVSFTGRSILEFIRA